MRNPSESPENILSDKKTSALRDLYRGTAGTESLLRLSADTVFSDLSLFVQQKRSRVSNENDSQILAYLYEGLCLPDDLIRYLVTYSVDNGKNDMKYVEKLGSSLSEAGITTIEEAILHINTHSEKKTAVSSPARRASEAKAGHSQERHTDYNELVIKELMEFME